METTKQEKLKILSNFLITMLGSLLAYYLSLIDDSFYSKIEALISYKLLLIASTTISLMLVYALVYSKIFSSNQRSKKELKHTKKENKQGQKKVMINLSKEEKDILARYIIDDTNSKEWNVDDGIWLGLEHKDVFHCPIKFIPDKPILKIYILNAWAREYILKNKKEFNL